jgi:hypothetical protein
MQNNILNRIFCLFLVTGALLLSSCDKDETPTKTLMQGNWQLTEASDGAGTDILAKIAFPVTVIQLTDDNGMVGTQGPMFTYVVYGGSNWVSVSAKIKQVFDYANFRFNTGEFFVSGGVVDRFTVEAKLQATAIAGGLTDILTILGVGSGWHQQVIYHKFIDVKVTFPVVNGKKDKETMIWEIDGQTTAIYNYKDAQGNPLLWLGWPVDKFSKGRFVFRKKVEGLNDIVKAHL